MNIYALLCWGFRKFIHFSYICQKKFRLNVEKKDGILSIPLHMVMFLEPDRVDFTLNLPSNEELKRHIQKTT